MMTGPTLYGISIFYPTKLPTAQGAVGQIFCRQAPETKMKGRKGWGTHIWKDSAASVTFASPQ